MVASEVKIFKISGKYVKNFRKYAFTKYVRALTPENAYEKVISQITSQKLLRRKVTITENVAVPLDQCPDLYIQQLSTMGDN